jgi:hypothetical protein
MVESALLTTPSTSFSTRATCSREDAEADG